MAPSNRRRAVLAAVGVVLGLFLGTTFAAEALAVYALTPVPPALLFAPVVGLFVYWWTDGVHELLGLLVVVSTVGIAVLVGILSTPVFVLDASTAGRSAVYQSGIFNALVSLLPAIPIVALSAALASVLDMELGLLERYHPRGETTRRLVAATLALALVAAAFTGVATVNYASVAEQSRADVTVTGVDVDDDGLRIGVSVPNRLTAGMVVRSIVVEVQLNDTAPTRSSILPRTTVPAGEELTFVVPAEEPSPAAYRNAESVRVTGVVRIVAFRGYETSLELEPWSPE
jgi:hypothetical protein